MIYKRRGRMRNETLVSSNNARDRTYNNTRESSALTLKLNNKTVATLHYATICKHVTVVTVMIAVTALHNIMMIHASEWSMTSCDSTI